MSGDSSRGNSNSGSSNSDKREPAVTAPHLARSIVARVAPPDRTDEVLGDLEETYRDRARRSGRFVASLISTVEAIDISIALIRERGDRRVTERRRRVKSFRGSPMWLDALRSDVRYALRGLRTHKAFTSAVVTTLALGIGVTAALFPVVDRLLFRMPPMLAEPSLTHRVYMALPTPDGAGQLFIDDVSYSWYRQFGKDTRSFTRIAQYSHATAVVGTGPAMRELPIGVVSASFFSFFDAPPAVGRYFAASDDTPPAGEAVAVLSYSTWQTRYAGSSGVVGSTLRIGSGIYTVIGVAPRGFVGVWPDRPPSVFVTTAAYYAASAAANGSRESWWTSGELNTGAILVQR